MKQVAVILCLLLYYSSGFAQNFRRVSKYVHQISKENIASVDTLSLLIGANFSRESERLRAIYGWICTNISYDVDRMANPPSFRGDSAVHVTLKSRKAICSGYADLFISICRALDIKAYYVSGYTKQNGVVADLEHAWVAVRLTNGQWKLFDPTWGAGEWVNGDLVKRVSFEYFMVEPTLFLKTHMPFDPMWQLLYQPIKTEEFYGEKLPKDDDYLFNYNDTIRDYHGLPESKMYGDLMRRMTWAGVRNESARRFYSKANKYYHIALESETLLQRELWLYAFDQQAKNYQTSLEMYDQLKGLEIDYRQRGVSIEQLLFSSAVLEKHTNDCLNSLRKLKEEKYADIQQLEILAYKVEKIYELIKKQNVIIRQLEK